MTPQNDAKSSVGQRIDFRYFLTYRRLSRKFRTETLERHWGRIVALVAARA